MSLMMLLYYGLKLKMRCKNTEKLFFNKYTCKVSLITPVASVFRMKTLGLIKAQISLYQEELKDPKRQYISIRSYYTKHINRDDLVTATEVISVLEDADDYAVRVEGSTLGVFVNDESFITRICNISGINLLETVVPKDQKIKEFLIANPRAVIRDEYTHKYKVYTKGMWDSAVGFKAWAAKMPKVKLVDSNSYRFDAFFYVQDDRAMTMCRLYLNDKIRKVEEIFTDSEI